MFQLIFRCTLAAIGGFLGLQAANTTLTPSFAFLVAEFGEKKIYVCKLVTLLRLFGGLVSGISVFISIHWRAKLTSYYSKKKST